MRPEKVGAWVVVLLAALVLARAARCGEAGPARSPVAILLDRLKDTSLSDEERIAARDRLVELGARDPKVAGDLLELGKGTDSDNARMQVAIAVSQLKNAGEAVTANLDLFGGWLEPKGDVALRYWAAMAISRSESPKALDLLKAALAAIGEQEHPVLRAALVMSIGQLQGPLRKPAQAELVSLLDSKDDAMRVAAIEALRMNKFTDEDAIRAVFKVAKEDKKEGVWRAAGMCVQEAVPDLRLALNIAPGATEEERQLALRIWSIKWEKSLREQK